MKEFEKIINDAWENKEQVNQDSDKGLKNTINQINGRKIKGLSNIYVLHTRKF